MNTLYVKTVYFVTEQTGLFIIYTGGYPSPHIWSFPQNESQRPLSANYSGQLFVYHRPLTSTLGRRGGVKKVVVLGGAHHKVDHSPPSPQLWSNYHFFVGNFFGLESPDMEK